MKMKMKTKTSKLAPGWVAVKEGRRTYYVRERQVAKTPRETWQRHARERGEPPPPPVSTRRQVVTDHDVIDVVLREHLFDARLARRAAIEHEIEEADTTKRVEFQREFNATEQGRAVLRHYPGARASGVHHQWDAKRKRSTYTLSFDTHYDADPGHNVRGKVVISQTVHTKLKKLEERSNELHAERRELHDDAMLRRRRAFMQKLVQKDPALLKKLRSLVERALVQHGADKRAAK